MYRHLLRQLNGVAVFHIPLVDSPVCEQGAVCRLGGQALEHHLAVGRAPVAAENKKKLGETLCFFLFFST